jgi:hypothetical protein
VNRLPPAAFGPSPHERARFAQLAEQTTSGVEAVVVMQRFAQVAHCLFEASGAKGDATQLQVGVGPLNRVVVLHQDPLERSNPRLDVVC